MTSVSSSDAGSYTCTATNAGGSVTSNAATLTVSSELHISGSLPVPVCICVHLYLYNYNVCVYMYILYVCKHKI